jgi:Protein of unknown function (DUF2877)
VRLTAAASSALRSVLNGPPRPVGWLGASPAALYLATGGRPGVLAVLTHDAVRLPCGMLLASTSEELPLTALAPSAGPDRRSCAAGHGQLSWPGPAGPVVIAVGREWAPPRVGRRTVEAAALAQVRAALPPPAAVGIDGAQLAALSRAAAHPAAGPAAAGRLLGRGPGLTPSGDDVLAGFLIGATAFGLDITGARQAICRLARDRTTTLSAALLWHAAQGECIGELAALADAVGGRGGPEPAARRVLAVGHTSGAALAWGLVAAAQARRADRAGAAA